MDRWRAVTVKRPTPAQAAAQADLGLTDEDFAMQYPLITQYLIDRRWDDGKLRELSTLTLSAPEGTIQLGLNDKDARRTLYTSAATVAEALELMERAIREAQGTWRPWHNAKGGK
jgi:hypothetical protein